MQFVGTPGAAYGRHQTPTDMNNWAPRIGFAYHPFNNTVIRGAYGILYAPSMLQAAGTSGTSGTEGFTGGTALNSTLNSGQSFVASLSNPFPNGLIRPLGPQQGPISGTLTDIGGTVQDSYFNDYVNPMIQQWNFTVQQQAGSSWLLQAGYLGSKGQHLPDGESSTTVQPVAGFGSGVGQFAAGPGAQSVLRDHPEPDVDLCQPEHPGELPALGVSAIPGRERVPQADGEFQLPVGHFLGAAPL